MNEALEQQMVLEDQKADCIQRLRNKEASERDRMKRDALRTQEQHIARANRCHFESEKKRKRLENHPIAKKTAEQKEGSPLKTIKLANPEFRDDYDRNAIHRQKLKQMKESLD